MGKKRQKLSVPPRRWTRVVVTVVAVGLVGGAVLWRSRDRSLAAFPNSPLAVTADVVPADFAGTAACAACHEDQFTAWNKSTHGRAGGIPGGISIIAPFDGAPIVFADARVRPVTLPTGGAAFVVQWRDEQVQTLGVEGIVGGGHMEGGGTQGFFTRVVDGTLRFLPFDFSRHEGRWFCRTKGEPDGRWATITPEMRLGQCSDWPPHRTLGSVNDSPGCDQCHGSQISARFDTATRAWLTEYASLTVNCESCHGPARRHVELARSGKLDESAEIGLAALATLDKRASVAVCLQCHGEKLSLASAGGIVTPANLESRYSLFLPMLTDPPYTPDFRHKKFGYQGPHLASACFLDGSMTCTDCHDPHSQNYRDALWRPLVGRFDDGQCVSCHASKAEQVAQHTFHPAGSPGSRCVACHMPYLQNPGIGNAIHYTRADHVIPIPRPGDDEAVGVKSACAICHKDRHVTELKQQVMTWWGELKPRPPLVDGMLRALKVTAPAEAAALLLRPDLNAPAPQFAALSQYLLRFVRPDAGVASPQAATAIRELARSRDVDLAALSLAALHLGDGANSGTREGLASALRADANTRIRARWKLALEYVAFVYESVGDPKAAVQAYRKALELAPNDPSTLEQLGGALVQAGDRAGALAALESSLTADPDRVLTHMVLGLLKEQGGDLRGALASYGRATDLNPWNVDAQSRLAAVRLGLRDIAGARLALERVVQLDRSNVGAQVSLAQILAAHGERPAALARIKEALAFEPTHARARELLDQLRPR